MKYQGGKPESLRHYTDVAKHQLSQLLGRRSRMEVQPVRSHMEQETDLELQMTTQEFERALALTRIDELKLSMTLLADLVDNRKLYTDEDIAGLVDILLDRYQLLTNDLQSSED